VAFAQICGVGTVDELITDRAADPQILAGLTKAGVKVTTV
jgi:DeoR/GlpR family transcriptional regulator of sugar metabolism